MCNTIASVPPNGPHPHSTSDLKSMACFFVHSYLSVAGICELTAVQLWKGPEVLNALEFSRPASLHFRD
jgi:hypothetical protein